MGNSQSNSNSDRRRLARLLLASENNENEINELKNRISKIRNRKLLYFLVIILLSGGEYLLQALIIITFL